jgi:hypothetical protein
MVDKFCRTQNPPIKVSFCAFKEIPTFNKPALKFEKNCPVFACDI